MRDVGAAVERIAEARGFSVLRELTGHGIGRGLHEAPTIYNYAHDDARARLHEGLVVTIEPMIATGTRKRARHRRRLDGRHRQRRQLRPRGAHDRRHQRRADRPHRGVIEGLANLDAVCSATASRTEGGWRALDLRAWDGIDARLLPDRGLDCFGAWYRGVPLAWVSAVGERGPLGGRLRDDDWLRGFGGGLVATCGLRNVGAPSEGHGLHGEISHQPARDVRVARWVDGEQAIVSASATVAEVSALGHRLELERTWTTRTGEGRLELVDVTRNLGPEPEPAPLLYHVNLGAPLWSAGATLALRRARHDAARRATPSSRGTARWSRFAGARERVFEHEVAVGEDGWCAAAVDSPATGLRAAAALGGRVAAALSPVGAPRAGDRRARPRARQLLGPRPRRRPRGGAPARARAGRGARHAPRGPRRRAGLTLAAAFARVGSGTSHFPRRSDVRVSLDDPVIITCSISGSLANRDQCPAIPYTPEEYAAEARRIVDEGGVMIHIHARRPDGTPSYEIEDFQAITDAIRAEVGDDVIINFSTGADRRRRSTSGSPTCARCRPDVAALNMGSMNYAKYSARRKEFVFQAVFANPFDEIIELLEAMNELGIKPEHECFDVGHVGSLAPLVDMGVLHPPLHVSCVMGVTGGIPPTARNLALMADNMPGGLALGRHRDLAARSGCSSPPR